MKDPKHDCGPPCAELSEREHAFHLLKLADPSKPTAQVYRATCKAMGAKIPKDNSCAANGCRMLKSDNVQAAMGWHRQHEAIRYSKTKAASTARLVARAEGSDPRHFVEVKEGGKVEVKPWDGLGELTRGAATIEIDPDTSKLKKITVRDNVAAERALAELHGWRAPTEVKITPDLVARYQVGDEEAKALLQQIAATEEKKK